MGWDAYSSAFYAIACNSYPSFIQEEFIKASKEVVAKAGFVDGGLKNGMLDCSECAYMIEVATGLSCWDENVWVPSEIKFNWDFKFDKEQEWAYYSAKAFIDTCILLSLTIKFSW